MPQPNYSSATGYTSENFFTMLFDVALDAANPPSISDINVFINSIYVSVTAVVVDSISKSVRISFAGNALLPGDEITYFYDDPTGGDDVNAIQGVDGIDAPGFMDTIIVSGSRPLPAAPARPTLDNGSDSGTLGDGITNDTTPTVSGTALANATIRLYDTDGTTQLGSTTADGSGNWSVTSSALGAGSHTLKVTQTDTMSETSPLSNGLSLVIDNAAIAPARPMLAAGSDSGTLGDGITNMGTPVITGTAEANATVRLYDTDGTTLLGTTTANGGGAWSITSSNLATGSHTLTARQTDLAGNVSAASAGLAYILDTTGPVGMALSSNTVDAASATNGSTVATLSSSDITSVQYGFAVGNGTIDADNSRFSISGTSLVAAQNLAAGDYHIYLRATDAAGNDAFQIFTVTVTNAPSISSIVRSGAAAATVPAVNTSLNYTVTFSESVTGVDLSDFALSATGTASGTISAISGSGATYTVTVSGIGGDGTLRLNLNPSATGIQNGASVAIDGGYTAGQMYTLDHTAPSAPSVPAMTAGTDTGASNSDAVTGNITPVFTGTAQANAMVTLYDTDGTTVLGTATADGSGNWSITSSALGAGSHLLTARQTDAAGNVSAASAAVAVAIDTSAAAPGTPVLASASDSGALGDDLTNVAAPTITGTAEINATVRLYDSDGTTLLGTTTADGNGAWSIVSSTLSAGSHALTVKQTDVAGNVSAASAALVLSIDTTTPTAPGAPVLAPASDSGVLGDGVTTIATPTVTGTAEANATVHLYDTDGTTLLGTTTADANGLWSLTSSLLSIGQHTLTARQVDVAGNSSPAGASTLLTIEPTPAPPAPTEPDATVVDGVPVTSQPVTLPGGGAGTRIVVPVVDAVRQETIGGNGVADIALAGTGASTLLLAQVAPGYGLTATGGASQPAGDSSAQLIAAIRASTPNHPSTDQSHLTGNGVAFLEQVNTTLPLLVETIVITGGAGTPNGALTLTGTSTSTQSTALVIDAQNLASNGKIVLNHVDFAAIVGAATVTGNTEGQILTGDAAGQVFATSMNTSVVFAGGGSDTLALNWVPSPSSAPTGPSSILHGGLDADQAVFSGNIADYIVEQQESHVMVSSRAQPQNTALVINVERLVFADTTLSITHTPEQTVLAGLYQNVLGRQADYLGFEFWADAEKRGSSLGDIALELIASPESQATRPWVLNGNNANDIAVLYQAIFDRAADAEGLAFWQNAMKQGATLSHIAEFFLGAPEMATHLVGAPQWDFFT